jgi:hypothetical protein
MWNFCLFYLDLTGVYPTEDLLERFGHVDGCRRSRGVLRLPMQQTYFKTLQRAKQITAIAVAVLDPPRLSMRSALLLSRG